MFEQFLFPEEQFPEREWARIYLPFLPEFMKIVDGVNDVISFYKESVVGSEENNFIMNVARAERRKPEEVWRRLCKEQVEVRREIMASLRGYGHPGIEEVGRAFVNGYVGWHVQQKRYRLAELGIISD